MVNKNEKRTDLKLHGAQRMIALAALKEKLKRGVAHAERGELVDGGEFMAGLVARLREKSNNDSVNF